MVAQRKEYYFGVVKTILFSSSYRVLFFLLYGQKSEQANRENPRETCFSRATYFFISSLVKIWKVPVF